MRSILYVVDVAQMILFTLADLVIKSKLWLILFAPLLALLIPFMIWYSEREAKGRKVDYPH